MLKRAEYFRKYDARNVVEKQRLQPPSLSLNNKTLPNVSDFCLMEHDFEIALAAHFLIPLNHCCSN